MRDHDLWPSEEPQPADLLAPSVPQGLNPAAPGGLTVPPSPPAARRHPFGTFVEALLVVLLALVIALLLKVYVAEAYEIRGRSMQKTFKEDERVMVLKVLYEIHRGDIIIFAWSDNGQQKDLIKRVIGLPGDSVLVRDGSVYVNGRRLEEPYSIPNLPYEHYQEVVVPQGRYYVLGDNRPDSQDSRSLGCIDASAIKGKVVLRWWPLERLGSF